MIDRFTQWWTTLSARERVLLSAMAALLAILFVWLGMARPVDAAHNVAQQRHEAAVDRHARIAARVAALDSAQSVGSDTASTVPIDLIVTDAASEAGLTIDTSDVAGPNDISITIARAQPQAVLGWLAAFEGRGIVVTDMRITGGPDGSIALDAKLKRTGS